MGIPRLQYYTIPNEDKFAEVNILMVGWFSVDERDEPKSCMLFSSD
jgi:hypothetical protein